MFIFKRYGFLLLGSIFFIMAPSLYAMQIFIADHSFNPGSTITIEVEASESIESVKAKINDKRGIPIDQQYLYYHGTFLQDSNTLSDYGIGKEQTLDLYNYDTSLPVSLTEFTAQANGSSVLIQWVTESETDNLGFILEKSIAGSGDRQTIASWTTHPELAGQGSKSSRTEYAFIDVNVKANTGYTYRLASVSIDGTVQCEKAADIYYQGATLPLAFRLEPLYPNPFNSSVRVVYHLERDRLIDIKVYDMLGRLVTTLQPAIRQAAGTHTITWDGTNQAGLSVPSGEYFIHCNGDGQSKVAKALLIK